MLSEKPVMVSEHNDRSAGWLAARLREATQSAHHRIDHHPLMASLVRPDLTLGGQVIARQLAGRLNLGRDNGARFFHGWGMDTRQHWDKFWHFAESACTPTEGVQATRAACLLFERLHAAFDEALLWKENPCN